MGHSHRVLSDNIQCSRGGGIKNAAYPDVCFSYLLLSICQGHFRKVTKYMMEQLRIEQSHFRHTATDICNHMSWMGAHYPTLTLQWSNILMLLNYEDQSWWKSILSSGNDDLDDSISR